MEDGWKIGALIPWLMLLFAVLPDPVPGPAILVDAAPCFHPLACSLPYTMWRSWQTSPERYLVGRSFNSVPAPAMGEDDDNELISAANILPDGRFSKIKRAY